MTSGGATGAVRVRTSCCACPEPCRRASAISPAPFRRAGPRQARPGRSSTSRGGRLSAARRASDAPAGARRQLHGQPRAAAPAADLQGVGRLGRCRQQPAGHGRAAEPKQPPPADRLGDIPDGHGPPGHVPLGHVQRRPPAPRQPHSMPDRGLPRALQTPPQEWFGRMGIGLVEPASARLLWLAPAAPAAGGGSRRGCTGAAMRPPMHPRRCLAWRRSWPKRPWSGIAIRRAATRGTGPGRPSFASAGPSRAPRQPGRHAAAHAVPARPTPPRPRHCGRCASRMGREPWGAAPGGPRLPIRRAGCPAGVRPAGRGRTAAACPSPRRASIPTRATPPRSAAGLPLRAAARSTQLR